MATSTDQQQPGTSSSGCGGTCSESYYKVESSEIDEIVTLVKPGGGPELRYLFAKRALKVVGIGSGVSKSCERVGGDAQVEIEQTTNECRWKEKAELAERDKERWKRNFREESDERRNLKELVEELERKLEREKKENEKRIGEEIEKAERRMEEDMKKMECEIAQLKGEVEKRRKEKAIWEKDRESNERFKRAAMEVLRLPGNLMDSLKENSRSGAAQDDTLSPTVIPDIIFNSSQQPVPQPGISPEIATDLQIINVTSLASVPFPFLPPPSEVESQETNVIAGDGITPANTMLPPPPTSKSASPAVDTQSSDKFEGTQQLPSIIIQGPTAPPKENVPPSIPPIPHSPVSSVIQPSPPPKQRASLDRSPLQAAKGNISTCPAPPPPPPSIQLVSTSNSPLPPPGTPLPKLTPKPKPPHQPKPVSISKNISDHSCSRKSHGHKINLASSKPACECGSTFSSEKAVHAHISKMTLLSGMLNSPRPVSSASSEKYKNSIQKRQTSTASVRTSTFTTDNKAGQTSKSFSQIAFGVSGCSLPSTSAVPQKEAASEKQTQDIAPESRVMHAENTAVSSSSIGMNFKIMTFL